MLVLTFVWMLILVGITDSYIILESTMFSFVICFDSTLCLRDEFVFKDLWQISFFIQKIIGEHIDDTSEWSDWSESSDSSDSSESNDSSDQGLTHRRTQGANHEANHGLNHEANYGLNHETNREANRGANRGANYGAGGSLPNIPVGNDDNKINSTHPMMILSNNIMSRKTTSLDSARISDPTGSN